jgi:hypothetical protein
MGGVGGLGRTSAWLGQDWGQSVTGSCIAYTCVGGVLPTYAYVTAGIHVGVCVVVISHIRQVITPVNQSMVFCACVFAGGG